MCNRATKHFTLFCIGGSLYGLIECVWRGYTHISMILLSGILFLFIGALNEHFSWDMSYLLQVLIGTIAVTFGEFFTGCIVNILLDWNVWDYSNMPLNLLGQICVPYILLWVPLTAVAIILDDFLRFYFWGEDWPHYKLF